MFSKNATFKSTASYSATIEKIKVFSDLADVIIVGAGSGLSTAAGMTYDGPRFQSYFADFHAKYGLNDMYSGGFYHFPTPGERWAWWSRVIWLNRDQPAPNNTYKQLVDFLRGRNYFVLTTNVDHQFQLAGIDKSRLFYTQGDYGLFQCEGSKQTFDNYQLIKEMVLAQGFRIGDHHELIVPRDHGLKMNVPDELVDSARPYSLNLRVDSSFVEDDGWHQAAIRFNRFIARYQSGRVLYLELGVGMNTPGIIKYPFWNWTYSNPGARFVIVDNAQPVYPQQISQQATAIRGDLAGFVQSLVVNN